MWGRSRVHQRVGRRWRLEAFDKKEQAEAFKKNAATALRVNKGKGAPDTVEEALKIPVGNSAPTSDMEGKNWSASATAGGTIAYGQSKSASHQITVKHVHDTSTT